MDPLHVLLADQADQRQERRRAHSRQVLRRSRSARARSSAASRRRWYIRERLLTGCHTARSLVQGTRRIALLGDTAMWVGLLVSLAPSTAYPCSLAALFKRSDPPAVLQDGRSAPRSKVASCLTNQQGQVCSVLRSNCYYFALRWDKTQTIHAVNPISYCTRHSC